MRKVSIGLPVFDGQNYVSEAIASILGQTYGDFDLFISDNASTDATEEICRAYAKTDQRIRYIRQPRNLGAAPNFNVLVPLGDAPYFKWAAHDDLLAPGFLAACVDVLDRDPSVVIASPASAHIDNNGKLLPYSPERGGMVDNGGLCWPPLPEENDGLMATDPMTRFEAVMLKMVICVEQFGLMRRSALSKTSLMGAFIGSDKVLMAQMSLLGRFWLGQETLFFRRCHSEQLGASTDVEYRESWFSGRRDPMYMQRIKLLLAYLASLSTTKLTLGQRCACLHAMARRVISTRDAQWRLLTGALVRNDAALVNRKAPIA